MIDGGFGGQTSDGAVEQLASWQALLPDMHYWLLGWGTNDALNNVSADKFRTNFRRWLQLSFNKAMFPYSRIFHTRRITTSQD